MANAMNSFTNSIVFMDSVKNPITAPKVSEAVRVKGLKDITVEVSGVESALIVVEGTVNTLSSDGTILRDEDCAWTTLGVISAENYKFDNCIKENGIYFVGVSGCTKIRVQVVEITGLATIVAAGVE